MRALQVGLFAIVISLPLAANLAGVDGADPGAENRELAEFRRDGFTAWFNDHFGFRSMLVRWYGESRLFVLGVSPSTAVIAGRDGWFFYGDDKGAEDYANEALMTPEAIANWRLAVFMARNRLPSRGTVNRLTAAPDKHKFYDQDVPSSLHRVKN